jgi:chemotaxis protein CheD
MGAICHGTLPQCRSIKEECLEPCIEAFKFMDCAMLYMLRAFRDHGIMNNEIEIKVFGGADTLASKSSNTIGSQNIKTTLDIIRKEKLSVMAADVGDSFGRKLVFFTHTGDVYLKRLKTNNIGKKHEEKG